MNIRSYPNDYLILGAILLLSGFGIVMMYIASSIYAMNQFDNYMHFFLRQTKWLIIGTIIMFVLSQMSYRYLKELAYVLIILSWIILIMGYFFKGNNLASRWLVLGGRSWMTTSDFARVSLIIFTAFFIDKNIVLRTHTSNVQIHLMENNNPPLRYIVPGRVYRNEAISFKSYCLFHQVEGLYVDKHVSFSEMKGMLEFFVKRIFGRNVKIRFRPSYFPFTEPSAEVDIWDEKRDQWMEILGCGSVDPAVFENVGYDPEIWQGYAFGMGIERIAMLKYKIADIRHFYQNDVRFLSQF